MVKGYVTIPVGYKRVDNLPILSDQLFNSKSDANTYVKSDPTAYVGQIFSVIDAGTITAYIVTAVGPNGTMKEIGSTSYDTLGNLPTINGKQLKGDLTLEQLGIAAKSEIPTVPTKVSELDNDAKYQTESEVNSTVSTAVNEVRSLLSKIFTLKGRVDTKDDLNSIVDPKAGDVYLVGSAGSTDVQEYVYVDNATSGRKSGTWEHIGDPSIDISNYYTKSEVDGNLTNKVDKVEGKGLSTNDYTSEDKAKVAKIITTGDGTKVLSNNGEYVLMPKPDKGVSTYEELGDKPKINGVVLNNGDTDTELSAQTIPIDYSSDTSKPAQGFTVQLGANGSVGGYKTGDTISADASILSVLKTILIKKIPPVYTKPSLSLSGTTPYDVEIGTRKALTLTPTFSKNDAGNVTKYTLKKGDASTGTVLYTGNAPQAYTTVKETVGSESKDFQITDSVTFTATVEYGQGAVKKDNLGNDDATGRIIAGSINSNTVTYHGRRAMFWGYSTSDITVATSADIRSLGNSALNPINGTSKAITTPSNTKCIVVAYPATLEDVAQIMQKGTNLDVKGSFVKTLVDVQGADGYTAVSYKVYKYTAVAGLNADTFTVTI